jgi:hypothetical protein
VQSTRKIIALNEKCTSGMLPTKLLKPLIYRRLG